MAHKPKALDFLVKTLGEDGLEELNKFELYKKKTNTTLNPEEIRIALQVVPRTILTLLKKELGAMKENEGKKIKIPVEPEAFLEVTKFANDVYSGEIIQEGKSIGNFRYRSLPGVGLAVMTALELYDIADLDLMGRSNFLPPSDLEMVQNIIDEKLKMRDLISRVVDQKLSEREAIDEMVRMRLTQLLLEGKREENTDKMEQKKDRKPLKLKEFLEKKSKKQASPSYEIKIEKSENVTCPDCGKKIFDSFGFSGCICFGPDRNKKIHIRKSEKGVALSFSKTWDKENIEMLLEVLRERNNRSNKDEK